MKTKFQLPLLAAASLASSSFAAPLLQIKEDVALQFVGSAGVEYSDNLLFQKNNAKQDALKFSTTPGLRLNLGDPLAEAYAVLTTQEQLTAYTSGFSHLNNQLNTTKAEGVYDNGKLKLGATAAYAESDQNAPEIVKNGTQIITESVTFGLTAAYKINSKVSASTGVDYNKNSYSGIAGLNDNKSWSIPVNFYYAINPNLDGSLGYRHRENQVDGVINGDSQDNYYNVGLRGSINAKLSGSFNVGYQVRTFDSNAPDTGSLAAMGRLTYTLNPKTQIDLDLDSDLSLGATGGSVQRTGGQISLTNQFSSEWTFSGFFGYRNYDYANPVISRNDDNIILGAIAKYSINRYLTLTGRYQFQDNISETVNNANDIDYKVNTVSLVLDCVY